MFDKLKDIFNDVYFLIYEVEYNFSNKQVIKNINSFIKTMPQGASDNWLYDFILFQFAYYDGMKTRFDRVYVNWILGPKAIQRWADRTEQQVYYANEFKRKIGFKKPQVVAYTAAYMVSERLRFEDVNRQYIHCVELSLFNLDSAVCKCCKYYSICYNSVK